MCNDHDLFSFSYSVGQDIIIEEGPLSLLIPTGHIGTFSCKSCCTHCHGYWIIDNNSNIIPSQNPRGREHLESEGFTFSEGLYNESNQQCHVMMVTINASESVNASNIQCHYCPTADQRNCRQSDEATLLVIASKSLLPKCNGL